MWFSCAGSSANRASSHGIAWTLDSPSVSRCPARPTDTSTDRHAAANHLREMIFVLTIYLAALGCWLGGIVFFSFFTAPAVFTVLPRPEAGQLISTIFPRYYMVGSIVGTISLVLAIYFTAVRGPRIWWGGTTVVLAIALGITFYAGTVILPHADALRTVNEDPNPDPVKKAEFDKLHHTSVILNGTVLLLNLAAIVGTSGAL